MAMKIIHAIKFWCLILLILSQTAQMVNADDEDLEQEAIANACSNTARLLASLAGTTADSLSVTTNIHNLAIPFYVTRGASELYHILVCDALLQHKMQSPINITAQLHPLIDYRYNVTLQEIRLNRAKIETIDEMIRHSFTDLQQRTKHVLSHVGGLMEKEHQGIQDTRRTTRAEATMIRESIDRLQTTLMNQFAKVHNHIRRSTHLLSSQLLDIDQNMIANFAQIDRLFASVCMRLDQNLMTLEDAIDRLEMTTDGYFFKIQYLFATAISKIDDNLQEFHREMHSCTNSIGQSIHDAHEETMHGLSRIADELDVANENLQSIGIVLSDQLTSMESDITSLYYRIEHGFAHVQHQLDHIQLTQNQQRLQEINSKINRLWMSYIKYCRSILRNSTVEPVEFWRKRLATFCASPTHDPISALEAVHRETIACGQCLATRVPDDEFVAWRINVVQIMEQAYWLIGICTPIVDKNITAAGLKAIMSENHRLYLKHNPLYYVANAEELRVAQKCRNSLTSHKSEKFKRLLQDGTLESMKNGGDGIDCSNLEKSLMSEKQKRNSIEIQ